MRFEFPYNQFFKIFLSLISLPLFVLFGQDSDDELINPKDLIPDIVIDLKYATSDHKFLNLPEGNISLPKFYTANECLLLGKAVKLLKIAQDSLRNITQFNGKTYPKGIGIKIWDGYRPLSVQYLFWEIYPNPTYIANPANGSKHNRGGAVDLTLIDLATGAELKMPTPFDDFSEKASHSYTFLPQEVIQNRSLLKSILTQVAGMLAYEAEWWHYEIPGANNYPLLDFQMK
jgi:D-alanyl-D-alanine dipeptidase